MDQTSLQRINDFSSTLAGILLSLEHRCSNQNQVNDHKVNEIDAPAPALPHHIEETINQHALRIKVIIKMSCMLLFDILKRN